MKNISKETAFFQYKNEAKFEYNLYLEYINYYKKKNKLYSEDTLVIEIEFFPILVGDYIKPDYYNDIYSYLYIDKHNLTKLLIYPKYIREIKNKKKKYNKKKFKDSR